MARFVTSGKAMQPNICYAVGGDLDDIMIGRYGTIFKVDLQLGQVLCSIDSVPGSWENAIIRKDDNEFFVYGGSCTHGFTEDIEYSWGGILDIDTDQLTVTTDGLSFSIASQMYYYSQDNLLIFIPGSRSGAEGFVNTAQILNTDTLAVVETVVLDPNLPNKYSNLVFDPLGGRCFLIWDPSQHGEGNPILKIIDY